MSGRSVWAFTVEITMIRLQNDSKKVLPLKLKITRGNQSSDYNFSRTRFTTSKYNYEDLPVEPVVLTTNFLWHIRKLSFFLILETPLIDLIGPTR